MEIENIFTNQTYQVFIHLVGRENGRRKEKGVGPISKIFLSLLCRKRNEIGYNTSIDIYTPNYRLKYHNNNKVPIFTLNLLFLK